MLSPSLLLKTCSSCSPVNKSSPITITSNKVHFRNKEKSSCELAESAASAIFFCGSCGSFSDDKEKPKSRSVDDCREEIIPSKEPEDKYVKIKATERDTLTGLAARYETTPAIIVKLNRLGGRTIFPGQELLVPKTSPSRTNTESDSVFETSTKKVEKKFVKVSVRHITDGNGVVSGTLLITPNAVMFDPNVSDPLVIEQGAESYGVILPLEVVVCGGILSDVSGMRVEGVSGLGGISNRVGLYGRKKEKKKKTLKRLSFPLTWMDSSSNEDLSVKQSSAPTTASHDKKRDGESFISDEESGGSGSGVGGVLRRSFERLLPSTSSPPLPTTSPSPPLVNSQDFTPLSASPVWYLLITTSQPLPGTSQPLPLVLSYGQKNYLRPEYWFQLSNEQVEELYQFWMLYWPETYGDRVDGELLTQRNHCLTTFSTTHLPTHLPKTSSSTSTSPEINQEKESWEMIKSPYTRLSSLLNRSSTLLTSTSSSATNFGQGLLDSISDFASVEYYEQDQVVSMSEELRAALEGYDEECLAFENSEVFGNEEDCKGLGCNLVARMEGHPPTLIFTSSSHGFSLSTLYRKNDTLPPDTPILLVIAPTESNPFGALLSSPLRPMESSGFYGNGQSFVFTLEPFHAYKWTGLNSYFVKSGWDGIAIGAEDGKFSIWLDSDLNKGRTDSSCTYNNPPLTEGRDFVVKTIECWAFLGATEEEGNAANTNLEIENVE